MKNKNLIYLALLGLGIYIFSKKGDSVEGEETTTPDVGNGKNDFPATTTTTTTNTGSQSAPSNPTVETSPDGASVQTFTY
jgi:hypothetical protein